MTSPDRLKLKASLIIVATFVLGTMTGAALGGIYLQASARTPDGHAPAPAPLLEGLRRDLNLTDQQAAEIRAAIEDTRRTMREVRLGQCPGLSDARQRLIERVRPLLTPTQQLRFDAIIGQRQMRGEFPQRDR